MTGIWEKLESWLTYQDSEGGERRGRPYGTVFLILLSFTLMAVFFSAGLGWLPQDYIPHGLLFLPAVSVLAGIVSSPTAVLTVGLVSAVLGITLPLTVKSVADYVITAPVALAMTTGLTWLAAQRCGQARIQVLAQRAQWVTREQALTDQVEAQTAELTALRQEQETWRETAQALAAPVLPVWEGVVVLPLVGPLDEERARLARRTLLEAIKAQRTHTVVLDVTGLSDVTAQVIEELASLTRAVELTGCQTIIAGVRPPTAQRMAELEAKLGNAAMRRNLQAAIAHALRRDDVREHGGTKKSLTHPH